MTNKQIKEIYDAARDKDLGLLKKLLETTPEEFSRMALSFYRECVLCEKNYNMMFDHSKYHCDISIKKKEGRKRT